MFLGADTEELQEAGQKCQEGAEATGQVIQYLRALVIALKAASFFTGGASAAYAQYLETTVIPWLERVKQALDLFAKVLLAHADAQNKVSAGESVDWGGLPTYRTPALPAGDTRDYPPLVSGTPGPVTASAGGSPAAPAPGTTTPGSTAVEGFGPADQVGRDAGVPGGTGTVTAAPGGAGVGAAGTGSAGGGTGAGSGTPLGGGTPGGLPAGAPAGGDGVTPTTGSPTISTGTVDGTGGATGVPVTEVAGREGEKSYGAAAGIAGGAAALGLGGAAAAARRGGSGTDPDIERLVATNGRGSRGEEVRQLQERLTAAGYDTQGTDGQWGRKTEAAYEAWRTDHPLQIATGTGYTSPSGFDYNRVRGVEGNAHVTPEFLRQMEGVAQRVGARPEDLMAVMALESNRTFAPDVRNADTGATGLIQFMPSTARGLGTTTTALAQMSATEQLPYVERYLAPRRGHIGNLEGLYTSILYGSPQDDPSKVLWSRGTEAYGDNHGLDRNRDGRITAGEAADSVRTFVRN